MNELLSRTEVLFAKLPLPNAMGLRYLKRDSSQSLTSSAMIKAHGRLLIKLSERQPPTHILRKKRRAKAAEFDRVLPSLLDEPQKLFHWSHGVVVMAGLAVSLFMQNLSMAN